MGACRPYVALGQWGCTQNAHCIPTDVTYDPPRLCQFASPPGPVGQCVRQVRRAGGWQQQG